MTPMVRVANTGVSCFINYHGQVEDSLPILESGSLFVQLHSGEQLPLSRFIGDAVAWVCLFVGILLVLGSCFKRSKKQ
ncbi:MAG: apolipoprotein N-acyltransferase, partial [Phycisphaerales bacterium]